MIAFTYKSKDGFKRVRYLTQEAATRATFRSAGYVRTVAARSIKKPSTKRKVNALRKAGASTEELLAAQYPPSAPGTPPHTHTGQLRKAIAFAADPGRGSFVIGPKRTDIAEIGSVHEFGKEFRGRKYPPRPFMRPALEKSEPRIAENFRAMLNDTSGLSPAA